MPSHSAQVWWECDMYCSNGRERNCLAALVRKTIISWEMSYTRNLNIRRFGGWNISHICQCYERRLLRSYRDLKCQRVTVELLRTSAFPVPVNRSCACSSSSDVMWCPSSRVYTPLADCQISSVHSDARPLSTVWNKERKVLVTGDLYGASRRGV